MIDLLQSDRGLNRLTAALDALSAQQRAIANNIANVDTPGYHRRSVSFDALLARELATGGLPLTTPSEGQMPGWGGSASHISDAGEILASGKNDGNTVEIEREMTDLTQNQIKYYAVSQAMASRIGILHEIVTRAV